MIIYKVRESIRKNKKLENKLRIFLLPIMQLETKKYEFMARYGQKIQRNKYAKLSEYKNRYSGKRCFIVATGPSLTLQDIETLQKNGEYTFGVNSIVTALKDTSWRPTFYCIQDYHAYLKFYNEIKNLDAIKFVGSIVKKYHHLEEDMIPFPQCVLNHGYAEQIRQLPEFRFSEDASLVVYDGYTIVYSAIQLAFFMGFNEIYLLGVDCNYASGSKYFNKESERQDIWSHNSTELMIQAFQKAADCCRNTNTRIYNATRGGKLEVFPRRNFDDLFDCREERDSM